MKKLFHVSITMDIEVPVIAENITEAIRLAEEALDGMSPYDYGFLAGEPEGPKRELYADEIPWGKFDPHHPDMTVSEILEIMDKQENG